MGNNSQNGTNSSNNQDTSSNESINLPWWFWGILVAIFIFWAANGFLYFYASNKEHSGVFGDQFGAINSLFSGFAFAGLIYTIIQQNKSMEIQQKELKQQIKEFKTQNDTLAIQRFENTFFNMLSLHQKIVEGLNYDSTPRPISFEELASLSNEGLQPFPQNQKGEVYKGAEVFNPIYDSLSCTLISNGMEDYSNCQCLKILNHYFRFLYNILRYIDDNTKLTYDEKYDYAKILRASLSEYELLLLYYNGLSNNGKLKLKPLLEKYCMFNNLNIQRLPLSFNNLSKLSNHSEFIEALKTENIITNDFFFYLADYKTNDEYHISAFCKTEDEISDIKAKIDYFCHLLSLYKSK